MEQPEPGVADPAERATVDPVAVALPVVAWGAAGLAAATESPAAGSLLALAAAATWVALWGALSDRYTMVRGVRLAAVLVAAGWLHLHGVRIDAIKVPFSAAFVDVGMWSLAIAAFFMWFCASLFARAGTIPGVAYGIGAVAWLTLWAVHKLQPEVTGPAIAYLAAPVAAAPLVVRAYLPQSGRQTAGAHVLGFLLGAAGIMAMLKNTAFLAGVLPVLLVSVPLFGATYSYVRGLRRRPEGMALAQRRQHLHEVLLREGYSPRHVAGLLVAGSAWFALLAALLVALIELHFGAKTLILAAWTVTGGIAGFVALRCLPRDAVGKPDAIRLLGVRITPVTMDEALDRARAFIAEGTPHMIVTSDASGVVQAQDDAELREIMDEADLVTADGQGVVLASRMLDVPIRERVSGVDMVQRLCGVASEAGRSVFLLGGQEGVASAAAEKLRQAVPGLEIAGTQHGYFAPEEEEDLIRRVREARPAVLFVAFGIPRQEKWIRTHREALGVPVCIGVGGSFDVISGKLKRAPAWMRRCGLEWLFRVLQEPKRLPRLRALPRIAWLSLSAMLHGEAGETLPPNREGDTV